MKFVKLTTAAKGLPAWVNPAHVAIIRPGYKDGTEILFVVPFTVPEDNSWLTSITVRETVADVVHALATEVISIAQRPPMAAAS